MLLKRVLGVGLISAVASTGLTLAQADGAQSFGVFQTSCKTDQMTDERSCMIQANPEAKFFIDNGVPIFIAFIYPEKNEVSTYGFVRRLRVDKNRVLVGDCLAISSGPCNFKDKNESERFLKEMETGTTLHMEVGSQIFDFDLADYKKALAAYNEMRKPAAPATPPQ